MSQGHRLAVGRPLDEPQAKSEGNAGTHQTKVHIIIVRHFVLNHGGEPPGRKFSCIQERMTKNNIPLFLLMYALLVHPKKR